MNLQASPLRNRFLSVTGSRTLGFGRRRYGRFCLAVAGLLFVYCTRVFCTDRPCNPGQPAVTSITRRSVVLSWYGCSYDGGSTVTGYRIELLQLAQPFTSATLPATDDEPHWQLVTDACQVIAYRYSFLVDH